MDSIRSGNRQVLGCSGRGNEVLGFINFSEFFFNGRRPIRFEEGSAPENKITSYRVHRI